MKILRNNFGFSIIEALAGITIIATLAVIVTQFGVVRKVSKHGKMNTSCLSVAKSVIERVKDASVSGRIKTYIPNEGLTFPPANFDTLDGRMTSPTTPTSHQWAGAAIGTHSILRQTAANTFDHNAYLLIGSSLRYLTSAHNSNPGLCAGWGQYGNLTTVNINDPAADFYVAGDITKEAPPTIDVMVTPFNTADGSAQCGLGTIFIKPRSSLAVAPPAPLVFTPAANTYPNPSNANPELGMRLSVRVTYQDEGVAQTCEAGHDFQYAPDISPPRISFFEISGNIYNPAVAAPIAGQNPNIPANVCGATLPLVTTNVTMMMGVESGDMEEGTVFFCRDTSTTLTFNHDPTVGSGNKACINPTISTTDPARFSLGPAPPPSPPYGVFAPTPIEQGPNPTPGVAIGSQDWVPCHQVTLCGVPANAATTRVNSVDPSLQAVNNSLGRTQRILFKLDYVISSGGPNPALNPYCEYGMEVIAIDSAGNASSPPVVLTPSTGSPDGDIISATSTADPSMTVAQRAEVTDSFGGLGAVAGFNSTNYSPNHTAPPHCVVPGGPGNSLTLCIDSDAGDPEREWQDPWKSDPEYSAGYYTCLPQCCQNTYGAVEPLCDPFKDTP